MSARITTGQLAVTGTAAVLTTETLEVRSFQVKAPVSNAYPIYFGDSTVTVSTGYELAPGEEFDFSYQVISGLSRFDLQPQDIYIVGTAEDTACWFAAGRA